MSKNIFYAMDADYLRKYSAFKDKISAEKINLSTDEIKRISAEIQAARADGRELYSVDESGNAHITVSGPLEPKPDPCAIMFDLEMTTYADIIRATDEAEADESVKTIIYDFDTPGGNVVGLFATADKIRNTSKPTKAMIFGMAASAGYALASQTDEIIAENISIESGSIGVVTEIIDYSGQEAQNGVKRYVITSENAENKRPDVTTQEGYAKIQKRLTDLEAVFVEYVAQGRNTTTENVLKTFGHGAVFTARDAVKIGMIDGIESDIAINPVARNTTAAENQEQGEFNMEMSEDDIKKLVSDTAKATRDEMRAENEQFQASLEAENKRRDGFKPLLAAYPGQASMITAEMEKKDAIADAAFSMKVVEAEKARLSAEENQKKSESENVKPSTPEKDPGEKDDSGNALAAALGIKVGA